MCTYQLVGVRIIVVSCNFRTGKQPKKKGTLGDHGRGCMGVSGEFGEGKGTTRIPSRVPGKISSSGLYLSILPSSLVTGDGECSDVSCIEDASTCFSKTL